MARFLLIGLDGFEPSLADRWMAEGRLPNLSALRAKGTFRPLASTIPPATFPAWTTCVTGVQPGRHGIFDFSEVIPGQYGLRFVNSTYRKAPAVWNLLSDAGLRVGVLGVPGTYPPEPVNGFMVSGFDSPVTTRVAGSFVYPASLYPEVRGWRFADFQETDIGRDWHTKAHASLLDTLDVKEEIAVRLLEREPWDFFMVVFGESDTVAHHFWLFHDPESPRHCPGPADAIRTIYERLDRTAGRLIAAAGEETTVCVVSDHGFGGAGTGVVHLNNWLAEHGYLRFQRGGEAWLKRLALGLVPNPFRESLFRGLSGLAVRAESQSRFGGIDWAATTAWSEELNYFPSIRVNLAGREPEGQAPSEAYDRFVAELCARLEAWPPVARAMPRKTIYHGPHVDRAPDIVLELALEDGYSHSCLRSRGGPAFRRIRPEEAIGGKERGMNGAHRSQGVLFLSEKAAEVRTGLEDIAPTVLAVLGVAAPPMDGRALFGALDTRDHETVQGEEAPYSPEEEAEIAARLRQLGYLE